MDDRPFPSEHEVLRTNDGDGLTPAKLPAQHQGGARLLTIVDAASFADRPVSARLWNVDGWIPGATVTLLGGDGGAGKSLLAEQLGACTVLGRPWLGWQVRSGPCLFVSAEDDIDELHRRLIDIADEHEVSVEQLKGLQFVSLVGEDAILAAPEAKTNLIQPTKLFSAIELQVRRLNPVLVVLDTLSDLFGGDENQRAQARQFIGLLRGLAIRSGAAVLLLAHPSVAGMSSGSGLSGSTAWNNSVRSRIYLERIKGDKETEPDPNARLLKLQKANYAPRGAEVRLRWHNGVFLNAEASGGSFGVMVAQDRADTAFLELIDAYESEGRPVSHTPSANYAPSSFAADPRAQGITKSGFAKAMNRLFVGQAIKVVEYGPDSRRRKKLVRC